MVTLSEEIDNIKAYVYLLSIRFSDILKFSWDINSEKLDVKVPLLILQPLVENSFFHGISKKENGGEITVSVNEDGENVVVIIKDNGIGMTNEKIDLIFRKSREEEYEAEEEKENQDKQYTGNGIGMSNVIKRLRLFYDKEVFFIKSTVGEGTVFIIKIPVY
jgi:sensor histidine kinase YesM